MTEIQHLLALNMKRARRKRELSQMKLAELCDVSTSFIGEIESERKFPSAHTLQKITNALGLRPYQLFAEQDDWQVYEKYDSMTGFVQDVRHRIDAVLDEALRSHLPR